MVLRKEESCLRSVGGEWGGGEDVIHSKAKSGEEVANLALGGALDLEGPG